MEEEVILGDILLNHEAVHGRRSAEGSDMMLSEKRQQVMGVETVKVINKDRCFAEPLAIELAPHCFGPTSIGDGQVKPLRARHNANI